MKTFNTTGKCIPSIHYMVNIDRQVGEAAQLVESGNYFCINRGRQYGKTTTLAALANRLQDRYCVFNISFEGLGDAVFASVERACAEFLKSRLIETCLNNLFLAESQATDINKDKQTGLQEMMVGDRKIYEAIV